MIRTLLYLLRIVFLSNKAEMFVIALPQQLEKKTQFVEFCARFYTPWCLSCQHASNAPMNDLQLMSQLFCYKTVDEQCATSVLKSLSNHLWYISQAMIPLALYCDDQETSQKTKMFLP